MSVEVDRGLSFRTSLADRPTDSIWKRTANDSALFPRLTHDVQTDVAIIGGGFTGLSTAHHLAEAGIEAVVLDAHQPGWGCSGRNGGFAVARYKKGFGALAQKHGTVVARTLRSMLLDGLGTIESLIERYHISCEFTRCGHLTAAASTPGLRSLENDIAWLRSEGDDVPQLLSRGAVAEGLGTGDYLGGYLDKRSARLHPLNFARGFAAGLAAKGLAIFGNSNVVRVDQTANGVRVETASGAVQARRLVLATDGYTEVIAGLPDFHRRVVPVSSSLITTVPLGDELARSIVPAGWAVGDTKYLMNSFLMLPGNRFMFAGRGDITGRLDSASTYRGVEQNMIKMYPQLESVAIETRWSGLVAVTLDDFPHLGREGSNIYFALGYGGRGLVLSIVLGKALAHMLRGGKVESSPLSDAPFPTIPFHRLRIPGMKMVAGFYRIRDALGM
jgi:glycine/D-amino acid oxidase-like deaminating enzyme